MDNSSDYLQRWMQLESDHQRGGIAESAFNSDLVERRIYLIEVAKEATDHAVSGRYAQPSSSFSKSTLKLHVKETATANSTARINSYLGDGDAAEGEDSNQSDIITSEEDCTDDIIFVGRTVATDNTASSRYEQPSSSFSKSTSKLHVNETATENAPAQLYHHLVYVGATEGEDSNHIDIITSEEDCTDDGIFVSEGKAQLIVGHNIEKEINA